MNGRTVFAVNRSPVLAWNVEPPQPLPYADMPAAAAAISPADPYARCWQNQVDAGSGFSYFGALYNNSLPPTAYRLQPGCMANLGQFWPPTPPPDGCGRFDGSNLYLGPHVYRHGDNIPTNLRNSYQGLGHYSHVVEAPKESSQRTFKRETPISPNISTSGISVNSSVSKSENISTLYVDSKLKSQVTVSSTLPKQEIIPASSSSHEHYMCAPDSRGSSSMHPSTDKACFSPPYSLKSSINFHSSSQDSSIHKGKTLNGTQENNCNASPLKNVYFSSIESENVNSVLSKKFKNHTDEQYRFEPKSVPLDVHKSKNPLQSTNSFLLHNPYSSKKYDVPVSSQEFCNINSNCKIRADKQTDCVLLGEQQLKQRNNICRVKPEKSSHSDCKYQKSIKSSSALPVSEYRTSSDVFNIPTSVMPPKLEPNDKYFLSTCSSTVPNCMTNSYANTGPYLLKEFSPSYRNIVYPNSCSLSKPWHLNEMPLISPESYFKAPEAAKPPVPGPHYSSSVMHEGLISVAQTAPQDIDVIRMNGKLQQGTCPSKKVFHESSDDDEVQIISVQTKPISSTKITSRNSTESKTSQSPAVSVVSPLCLKSEKEPEETDKPSLTSFTSVIEKPEDKVQWIKTEPSPPVLEKEVIEPVKDASKSIEKCELFDLQTTSTVTAVEKCDVVSIKKEITQDDENVNNCDTSEIEQKVFKSETVESNEIISEQPQLSEEKNDDSSDSSRMPELVQESHENVPTSDFNDNHNLTLLLNTIEKVTSLEKSNLREIPDIKSEPTTELETSVKSEEMYPELPKTCGLDLLSVIAGQRLVTEFDGESEKDDIRSNYPLIKQENKDTLEQTKPQCDMLCDLQKATVFEMQDRLVELQKKYKQKQKELSRLKPKKRFASIYLNGRKKSKDENDLSSGSNMDSSDLNSSFCSASDEVQENQLRDEATSGSPIKVENKTNVQESKGTKRKLPSRKNSLDESTSQQSEKRIATRSSSRHSVKQIKREEDFNNNSESPRKTLRNSKCKGYQLRKSNIVSSADDDVQIISEGSPSKSPKDASKKSVLDNDKSMKAYSLRHSSQVNKKQECSSVATDSVTCSKAITSKRKSDNPKKYMPSKQGKLSETIIAKHLRSRILFDTSGSMSEEDTKDGGVPEELYDALMKCHLEDKNKKEMASKSLELSDGPLASPEPSRLKLEHLVLKQRLLALEDGLFYAGYIKEVQASDRYGIALDGQRGNRLHIFTQEELLTQVIVESKPLSSELPEGTRVCAYWSQQYRCLYPGIVGKAPCPSADWSEPRVFVLFDDGDSGQIPTKNIRLIPPDIIPAENDQDCDSPAELPQSSSDLNSSAQEPASRRLRCSTAKSSPVKECDTSNENESKDSSCASINDSSCDDSCFIEYSLSPSQNSENYLKLENSACSLTNDGDASTVKLEKRQRKRSKRKTSCRTKLKEQEDAVKEKSETKTKRHKKYKEKHRRHHHHHHHHRHHHHHHHHSKKHKHKKKNVKNLLSQDSPEKGGFIPCSSSHKSLKSSQTMDASEACTNHVEHSSTVNLPQNENDRVC